MGKEGGCSCGALRYLIHQKPLFTQVCHCKRCQKMTGTAFVMTAIIEKDNFKCYSGVPSPRHVIRGASGAIYDTFGCNDCGSTIFIQNHGSSDGLIYFPVGTLDCSNIVEPGAHIHVEAKQAWVVIPKNIPQFEQTYPDLTKLLSESSLARLESL